MCSKTFRWKAFKLRKRHKLHDVANGLLAAWRDESNRVRVKHIHGFECRCRRAYANDDDRHWILRGFHDGFFGLVHVCDHTVRENQEHVVELRLRREPRVPRRVHKVSDERSKVGRTCKLNHAHGLLVRVQNAVDARAHWIGLSVQTEIERNGAVQQPSTKSKRRKHPIRVVVLQHAADRTQREFVLIRPRRRIRRDEMQ
mmetsp:Transcript_15399/g.33136  ORF Transcript_15399/g.33136 Transcript_15399/m.33136 type:complete len:200 (+) Transcript_15399:546-1145(+)